MDTPLHPGDSAPPFELPSQTDHTVSLSGLRGSKVILYFYPAAGTPGCTTQACDFRDNLASLQNAGYTVLGISPDDPDTLRQFQHSQAITYPLLSDLDHVVHHRYGAWGDKTVNGRPVTGPLRSTFVVDQDGVLEQALYNVQAQGHVAQLRDLLSLEA